MGMRRKNLGKGLGKGYYNIIPQYDSYVHSLSAKGISLKSCGKNYEKLNAKEDSWFPEWEGIDKGYAVKGIRYDKGSEIYFLFKDKKVRDEFMEQFYSFRDIKDPEEYAIETQMLFDAYDEKVSVYDPYERSGQIEEKTKEGLVISAPKYKGGGEWTKEYFRIPYDNIDKIKGYVF